MARFSTSDGAAFVQGTEIDVPIQFLAPDMALPNFPLGTQFKIWAGKDVGVGEVISIGGTSNTSLERTREG